VAKYKSFGELSQAAERGDASAEYALGLSCIGRFGGESKPEHAIGWLRRAAERGHAGAQFELGIMYAVGRSVGRNLAEAVSWYRRAANQGHPAAQCKLGFMFATGQGVEKDDMEAKKWYSYAARQKHPIGLYETANSPTLMQCTKAAEEGHAPAQRDLGEVYLRGLYDVEPDVDIGKSWTAKAAEQGDPDAQRDLGLMHVRQGDLETALPFLLSAAEHGYHDVHFQLGRMYRFGHGVEKDYERARSWYLKAAAGWSEGWRAEVALKSLADVKEHDPWPTEADRLEHEAREVERREEMAKKKEAESSKEDSRNRLRELGYSFKDGHAISPSGEKRYIASSFDLWDLIEEASGKGAVDRGEVERGTNYPRAEQLAAGSLRAVVTKRRSENERRQRLVESQQRMHEAVALQAANADALSIEAVKKASVSFAIFGFKVAAEGAYSVPCSGKWNALAPLLATAGFFELDRPGPAEQSFVETVESFISSLATVICTSGSAVETVAEDVPHITDLNDHFLPYLHMGWDGYHELRDKWNVMRYSFRSAMNESGLSTANEALRVIYRKMDVISSLFEGSSYKTAWRERQNRNSNRDGNKVERFWSWAHAVWKRYPMESVLSAGFFNWLSSREGHEVLSKLNMITHRIAEEDGTEAEFRLELVGGDEPEFGRHIGYRLTYNGCVVCQLPLPRAVLAEFLRLRGFRVKLGKSANAELAISWK